MSFELGWESCHVGKKKHRNDIRYRRCHHIITYSVVIKWRDKSDEDCVK
jgi:hypothetical protein